jgi:hypothetical protein
MYRHNIFIGCNLQNYKHIGAEIMILYHGSNLTVAEPRLVKQNRFLDFGFGFYTTKNKAQAIAFSEKVIKRQRSGIRTVSIYEIDVKKAFAECSVLRFDAPDEAWLDFVSENRAGTYKGELYDFIFGPVADDDVYTTFTLYTAGVLSKEQTIEALKVKKLFNQLVLTTEKALSYLRFVGTVPEEEF